MKEFAHSAGDLWLRANNDQRIFLTALVTFALLFFLLAMFVLRWRIVNLREIVKSRHFASMRTHLKGLEDDSEAITMPQIEKGHPGALIGIAFSGVLLGAILGALANSINGWVSPLYFRNIMQWHDVEDIWRASIAQGILEGIMFGLAFAVIFTTVVGIVSKARSPYGLAAIHMVLIAVAALVCWALGGLAGMGLATLSPEFYRHAFLGVPDEFGPMLRYAWVGGSIWGIVFGGLASVIVGSVLFRAKWRHIQEGSLSEVKVVRPE